MSGSDVQWFGEARWQNCYLHLQRNLNGFAYSFYMVAITRHSHGVDGFYMPAILEP